MSKVTINVASPAKCSAGMFMPGEHAVAPEIAAELEAAGVLATEGEKVAALEAAAVTMSADEIDRMVAGRAEVIADAPETAVEQALTEIIGERDAAIARADALAGELAALKSGSGETGAEGEIAPAAEAKEAPKKGTKARKG